MPRTTTQASTPGFLVNPNNADRDYGHPVDWDHVPDAYKEATSGKKHIPAGTIVSLLRGSNKVVPRSAAIAGERAVVIAEAAGVATATQNEHGYVVGDSVTITGATGANAAAYNTTHTVTGVTDADTFTFAVADGTGNAAGAPKTSIPAYGILASGATEDSKTDALTGYGTIIGAVVNEDWLPDAGNASFDDWKAELVAASGRGFHFRKDVV